MDYKAKDKQAIMAYMKGKECVKVEDIIKEAGAEELRVYPILAELEQEGAIEVLSRLPLGAAEVVAIKGGGLFPLVTYFEDLSIN